MENQSIFFKILEICFQNFGFKKEKKKGPYKTYFIVLNWQCTLIPKVEWG
jgi:hypothetical protein